MDDPADSLERALSLIEQAHQTAAEAASVLRDAVDYDELAYAAIRVEAELGMLGVHIRNALSPAQAVCRRATVDHSQRQQPPL